MKTFKQEPSNEKGSLIFDLKWFKPFILVVLIGAMAVLAWRSGVHHWVDPARITELLDGFGKLAPLVFMGIMATAVVISPIPSVPLDAAAGAVFGPFLGTLYSLLGAEVGALIAFFITRSLGKEFVTRWLKSDIGFCRLCSEHYLFYMILFVRMVPIFSFDLVSYGAGLTRISVRGFAIATFLGMIPPTFAFNYFGSGIFSGSGYALALGGLMVILSLLAPKWIKQKNPWGLYERLEKHL